MLAGRRVSERAGNLPGDSECPPSEPEIPNDVTIIGEVRRQFRSASATESVGSGVDARGAASDRTRPSSGSDASERAGFCSTLTICIESGGKI
jgi:hypothetical protein